MAYSDRYDGYQRRSDYDPHYSRHAYSSGGSRRTEPSDMRYYSDAQPRHRPRPRTRPTWPPSPSVEEASESLTKEVPSLGGHEIEDDEPPTNTRGAVDQDTLLEDIELPQDQRFVLVPPINTDINDPPVFTERVSTPYAYTKPQRESFAPSPGPSLLSPEPLSARTPNKAPSSFSRPDSFFKSKPEPTDDLFDDSDLEPEDAAHLRVGERKPARYSFVKSDLQKEQLRTDLSNTETVPRQETRESGHRTPALPKEESFSSVQDHIYGQSPRSSTSSLNESKRRSKPPPLENSYYNSSRPSSRPASPRPGSSSSKIPSRLRESAPSSRPSSRGSTRPPSPQSFPLPMRPASPPRVPIEDADWHSTYPPITMPNERVQQPKIPRYDSMPVPAPRIDVRSPSPARPAASASALPYPVDDRPLEVFMPAEEHYQFDHSTVTSPRQTFNEFSRVPDTPPPSSPRPREDRLRKPKGSSSTREEPGRTRVSRSNSVRSQNGLEARSETRPKASAKLDSGRPLPSCPRSTTSSNHDDWYSLKGYRQFDVCPSCYEGVFSGTPFAVEFVQARLGERPTERFCDFSSPWVRLAWLLTIKQRLSSLELIYSIADVAEIDRPCPQDRELGSDRIVWYGIPDQKDGVHVANFAICSGDKRMIEALFPTIKGYFTKLPSSFSSNAPEKYMCSLRTSSRRFPKYLDLLVELDTEAQDLGKRPNIDRFVRMARENAFKGECANDKSYVRKPWHFAPSLPELTICEECYDEVVWPLAQSRNPSFPIARLVNKTIQLAPNEDPDVGSSCCLYSPRMRKVWDMSVREDDFAYLKRKAVDRKRAEARIARERKSIVNWMMGLERGSREWQRAKSELRDLQKEWEVWE